MFPLQLRRATQAAVYAIADKFGFQQFNPGGGNGSGSSNSSSWSTATAGLAADQLVALLRDAAGRRAAALSQQPQYQQLQQRDASAAALADWEAAICDVHAEYEEEYQRWRRKLCLPHPELQQQQYLQDPKQAKAWLQQQQRMPEEHRTAVRLLELALQFCIYSEAANLRHTPHLLFLLYYLMRGSREFCEVVSAAVALPAGFQPGQELPHTHWRYWASLPVTDFPAAAMATTSSNSSDGSSRQQQQEVVAGAADITALRRSLVQQLAAAAAELFRGPQQQQSAARGDTSVAAPAPAPAGSSVVGANGVLASASAAHQDDSQQQQQQHQQQQSSPDSERHEQRMRLKAAASAILQRVRQQHSSKHVAWVDGLLSEMCQPPWRSKQQTYLRMVVQPLFFFLSEQIDLAGQQAEEEPALRIGYCDVNENACSPQAVYGMIKALKQQYSSSSSGGGGGAGGGGRSAGSSTGGGGGAAAGLPQDLWQALLKVLDPDRNPPQPPTPKPVWKRLFGGNKAEQPAEYVRGRYPRDPKRLALLNQLDLLVGGPGGVQEGAGAAGTAPQSAVNGGGAAAASTTTTMQGRPALECEAVAMHQVYRQAKYGADWWATNLLRHKTYVEARSIANPFVAFWRVYAFHAALLTAMAALSYAWHEHNTSGGPIPWIRLVAALLLSTVTDALMRIARAGAHIVLLSYRVPVKRKVGKKVKALDPFPPGSLSIALGKLLLMLVWLVWAAVLAFAVIPVLVGIPLSFYAPLQLWVQTRFLWLAPAAAHVVFVWGHALLCQRPGYTTSFTQELRSRFARSSSETGLKAALALADKAGARAYCAADPAIDALFFPASNLVIDTSRWLRNAALWVVVFVLKVAFELPLVVYPLVGLMSKVARDQSTYLGGAIEKDNNLIVAAVAHATMLVAMAVPVILLSFSDTGLIFSVVGAAVAAVEGFNKGVGSIKTWAQMVSRFDALLRSYQEHCVSRSATMLHLHKADALAMQEVSMSALAAGWNALVLDLRQRDLLNNRELAALTFEQLQLTHSQKGHLRELPHVGRLGLTSVLPARCFMAGSVPELASGVVGSAHHLHVGRMVWGWLLWVSWQAGLLYDNNETKGATPAETDKLLEDREHEAIANLQHLTNLKLLHPPRAREQIQRWQELLSETVALLKLLSSADCTPSNTAAASAALLQAQGLEPPSAQAKVSGLLHGVPQDERTQRQVWRQLSNHIHRLLVLLDRELHGVEKLVQTGNPGRRRSSTGGGSVAADPMAALFGHRDADITPAEYRKAREALTGLRQRWEQLASNATLEVAPRSQAERVLGSRRTFLQSQEVLRLQVLEHIARVGQASDGPAQVCRWLTDVLTMYAGDTVPADEEAVRFVLTFASSLSDPGLGVAPSIAAMPSLTTLVPHYDEDVLYALSQDDAMRDLRITDPSKLKQDGMQKMLYLLTPDGSSTPTLSYLRSVYNSPGQPRTQWGNFVERVREMAVAQGIKDVPKQINEYHFLPGGPLHSLKQELLLWGSWRGQLLARTVRGLMSYRAALQALAQHENPHLMPAQEQQQLDDLQEMRHRLQKQADQLQQHQSQLASAAQQQPQQQQNQQQQQHETASKLAQVQQKLQRLGQALAPLVEQQQHWEAVRGVLLDDLVDNKYHLVVSSQNFGVFAAPESVDNMKASWLVHSIHTLRQKHPTLKIAFIDKQLLLSASGPGSKLELHRNASVLLASTQQRDLAAVAGLPVQTEAYRVLLPINFESARGVVIGEGKPENQNHAVVFCPGEALQTIDCNQDNTVSEGLKLRNLLAELLPEGWDTAAHLCAANRAPTLAQRLRGAQQGSDGGSAAAAGGSGGGSDNAKLLRQVPQGKGRVALVGFREFIFSDDSGALAEFAAATERSFGTTVQRLMYNPGACRFHYGHPDVWRRSFVSTCGGVSKANKGLHVSEDVFGGYNVMLRGRDIKYVDYVAVGKGRDMGFETINTFEAKIAAGNGEQVLSRDVRRLGHNMDFTRLMSWYHTGNGFFINTAITMLSVHASLWTYLLLALDKSSDPDVQKYLAAVQVLQLGTLSVLVYLFTLTLELGLLSSLFTIARQVLQGSLLFYIFRAQTSAYSFTYDLLFGGAKYLPTGRGYKLAATSFKELYRRFGRSHFYFGAILLMYAVACIAAGHLKGAEVLVLWAQFLVVASLLWGPFWFTPFALRTSVVTEEFNRLIAWFRSPSPQPEHSWQAWNAESWRAAANASGKQMGRLGACIRAHLFKLPTLVMVLAAVARMKAKDDSKLPKWAVALILAGGVLLTTSVILLSRLFAARTALKSQVPRILNLVATVMLFGGIAVSGWATSGQNAEQLSTYSNVFLVFFATVLLLRLLPLVHYSVLGQWEAFTDLTDAVYYMADVTLMYLLNAVRFLLSLFDILTGLQAQLLFNTAYARQVLADDKYENSKLPDLVKETLVLKRKQRAAQQMQVEVVAASSSGRFEA